MSATTSVPHLPPYVKVFGPQGNCTLDLCPVEYSVYGYRPSLVANGIFLGLYFLAIPIHVYLGIRWRTWWYMGCMIVGAINAIVGYSGRLALWWNPFDFAAFMAQIICVTSGPVYYCAAIYVTLSNAINYLCPRLSRFKPEYFYYIFIPCDMFSLILQACGGALSTASAGSSQIGVNLALAGLAFQVFTIVAFCGFFADYLVRYFNSPEGIDTGKGTFGLRLKLFFGFTGTAILLITGRCVFRLAELHQGYRGGMIKDEGLFIGLEGVTIVVVVYLLMVGHPGFGFKKQWRGIETSVADTMEMEVRESRQPVM